jgi:hypothetical protein
MENPLKELNDVLGLMERNKGIYFSFRRLRTRCELSPMKLRSKLLEMHRLGALEIEIRGKRNKRAFYRIPKK